MQDFYDAIVSQDARKLHEMYAPSKRPQMPYKGFRKYGVPLLREALVGTSTKVTVGLEQVCLCHRSDYPYDRVVCDLLVTAVQGSVTGTKQVTRHVDHWEYTDGEWFFLFPEMIEQCPPKQGN